MTSIQQIIAFFQVVWRKLGNVKAERQEAQQTSQPPVYENLKPVRSKSTPPDMPKEQANRSNIDRYHMPQDQMSQSDISGGESSNQSAPYIQRSDNSRGHTVFQVAPSHPINDPRKSADYPVQYQEGASSQTSQRPPPSMHNPAQTSQPSSNYGNQYSQGRYGHVQTTRSTPVTPTPQQQSQRMDPRSHSPGPLRRTPAPKPSNMALTPEPNRMQQYPRSEPQSYSPSPHVYQNQPPKSMGNNSYENVPMNYNYSNPRSQSTLQSHNRSQESFGSGTDYPPSTPNAFSQNSYIDYSSSSNKPPRSSNPYHPSHNQHSHSQSPPYYQNIPMKSNSSSREPQDGHYTSQNEHSPSLPQYSGHRNPTANHQSSYLPSSQPLPTYTTTSTNFNPIPPEYNAPPHYNDRRTSYIEARDNGQPYDEGRNVEHYYRK